MYFKASCFEISKIGLDRAFKYLLVSREAVKNIFVLESCPKTLDMVVMEVFSGHFCVRNYTDRLPRGKKAEKGRCQQIQGFYFKKYIGQRFKTNLGGFQQKSTKGRSTIFTSVKKRK